MNSLNSSNSWYQRDGKLYDTCLVVKNVLECVIDGDCDLFKNLGFSMISNTLTPEEPSVWGMTEDERIILEAKAKASHKPTKLEKIRMELEKARNKIPNLDQEAKPKTEVTEIVPIKKIPKKVKRTYAEVCAQGLDTSCKKDQKKTSLLKNIEKTKKSGLERPYQKPPTKMQITMLPANASNLMQQPQLVNFNIPPPPLGFIPFLNAPVKPCIPFKSYNILAGVVGSN